MKTPKYIEKLLQKQQRAGEELNSVNIEVHKWLAKQGVTINNTDIYCENSIMLITEPKAYADGIRRIIKEIE